MAQRDLFAGSEKNLKENTIVVGERFHRLEEDWSGPEKKLDTAELLYAFLVGNRGVSLEEAYSLAEKEFGSFIAPEVRGQTARTFAVWLNEQRKRI